ncbi:PREDICTED: L-type lectin-domain containing receptor kinase IX.1-like isoform X1 [Ipomoea nil]|uniref:L-type lectin-domain containing receptor kinase IX.1-like isoform X1 n=1 Tax=Ipomoea nil TaxID=35883 RepID=UPI000901C5B7|nr:PREDICTED: L-type lectin-domain containing receptor kinase IX.1-like isoform X1 [Ipomoea nil]
MAAAAALCRFLNIISTFLFLIPSLVCSQPLSFDLSHIDQNDHSIKIEGNAYVSGQGIQVTPNERNQEMSSKAGRATYVQPLHLWDNATRELAGFTTRFTFNIDSDGSTQFGDGLAFFLANFTIPFDTNSTAGGGLGLVDTRIITSPEPFVAVVFDTYSNEMYTPMTNVSININSMNASVNSTAWLNNITNGVDNNAVITYSASSKILYVGFTGFWDGYYQTGSLSYGVDLSKCLPEFVHIGFSAATGSNFEKHTVTSWKFDSTPLRSDTASVSPAPAPSPLTTQNHNNISSLVNPEGKNSNKKKGLEIAGFSIGSLIILLLLPLAIYTCCFKKIWAAKGDNQIPLDPSSMDDTRIIIADDTQSTLVRGMDSEFEKAGSGAKKFSYTELATATNNFSEERKLGEGGFGGVYLGFLRDLNLDVAVKRVSQQSKQGVEEYASEVKIISRLRHRNLVPLHGWCHEKGELLLVYEYMPGGCLHSHLFKRKSPLNWILRYRIAQGLASALSYLHEDWEQCVLHRDIKSSNVLLDSSFNARLGDFGLASLVDHEKAPEKTYLGGTPGYVAPECYFTFKTSKESDVYSFGIVALEIACGRKSILPNVPEGEKSLVDWVWDLYGMGRLLEAADPKLCGNFEEQEMERLMIIGLWCAHPDSSSRPKISLALHCLKFQVQLPILPEKMPKPVYSSTLPNALSFPASHFSGIKNVEIQEFEYPSSSSHNSRFTSSSASAGSSLPYTI